MGSIDLAEAERLCALAEEHDAMAPRAPWTFRPNDGGAYGTRDVVADVNNVGILRGFGGEEWLTAGPFVAEARTAWPALARATRGLLAELVQARAERDATRSRIDAMAEMAHSINAELEATQRSLLDACNENERLRAAIEPLKFLAAIVSSTDPHMERAAKQARDVLASLGEVSEPPDDVQAASAASLLPLLHAAWDRGEHTGDCENACVCWLGDIARAGAFGDAAMRHAETQAVEIGDEDLEMMIRDALDVLADPATLDEIVDATTEDAIANGRGMEPTRERVEAMLEILVGQGVVERGGGGDGEVQFRIAGDANMERQDG